MEIIFQSSYCELLLEPTGPITKFEKESVSLHCTVENATAISLTWNRSSDHPSLKPTLFDLDDDDQLVSLTLKNLSYEDAGDYFCIAILDDGRNWSKKITLDIIEPISDKHIRLKQNLLIYSTSHIECNVSTISRVRFSWTRLGVRIRSVGRYTVIGNVLQINNVSESDAGKYICFANIKSVGKREEFEIDVLVNIPPKFTDKIKTPEVMENDSVSISCLANGIPSPKYSFYKDDDELLNSSAITIDEINGSLKLKMVSKSDGGMYKCKAENRVGNASIDFNIKILIKPIIAKFEDVNLKIGSEAKLTCRAQGNPLPGLSIVNKNEVSYIQQKRSNRLKFSDQRRKDDDVILDLSISSLQLSDTGEYHCLSKNSVGGDNKIMKLIVEYPPKFLNDQMIVSEMFTWLNHTVNISCEADGIPYPEIHWLKDDNLINNSEVYNIYEDNQGNSMLIIKINTEEENYVYGNYSCIAKNIHDKIRKDFIVKQATIPESPIINVSQYFATILKLDITPQNDGGLPILGYQIFYKPEDEQLNNTVEDTMSIHNISYYDFIIKELTINDKELEVTNLKPSTMYIFEYLSYNEVGPSMKGHLKSLTSGLDVPSNVNMTSFRPFKQCYTPNKLNTFTWNAPYSSGLQIDGYKIRYSKIINPDKPITNHKYEKWLERFERNNSTTFQHLFQSSTYNFSIEAKNSIGLSNIASISFKTCQEMSLGAVESQEGNDKCKLSMLSIILIVAFIILLILIMIDIGCCFCLSRGLTYMICIYFCKGNLTSKKMYMENDKHHGENGNDMNNVHSKN